MTNNKGKRRILLVGLGGTIAMTRSASGGIIPSLSAEDLVRSVPGLQDVADIVARSPFRVPGASLDLAHLRTLAELVTQEFKAGAEGAVIVQGTDSIEETAFVLGCLLDTDHPVVVTGAMRGAEAAGADGPANLLAAVTVASSGVSGLGTVVVLNDEVHAARFVRKGHTGLPSAFLSTPFGPVGHIIEGQFWQQQQPIPLPRLALPAQAPIPPVALMHIGLGEDGRLLPMLKQAGYEGAVIAAMGAGHVPETIVGALQDLAREMPVILSTRVLEGPVFQRTYGFPGSEIDLQARGLILGGSLGPLKSRLLLQLLLANGTVRSEDLAEAFRVGRPWG